MPDNPPPTRAVAVVMPTRNQAAFIGEAVASVFAQGIPGLRLVVQDGASTDGTLDLLHTLAAAHPGLDLRSEPDAGPADALNRGFARALADPAVDVIGWLNSDDLYTPGAIARALAHFETHPGDVLVYGEGEHVDVGGRPLGRYPTCAPGTALATWADGCPICQPTVVLRREAAERMLPLDVALRTAFDFDAWLRLWKAFPGRIGYVGAVQAHSRLHDAGITLRQRETVAMEALQLIHRHLGPAPGHWLATYFDEFTAGLPDGNPQPPRQRLQPLVARAEAWLSPAGRNTAVRALLGHRGLQLALPDAYIALQADGWMTAETPLRLQPARDGRLRLGGRHTGPQAGPLQLQAHAPDGSVHTLVLERRGPFEWLLPVAASPDALQHWVLRSPTPFVPALAERGSQDRRALVCQIDTLQWSP